jgi:hypothetical protein
MILAMNDAIFGHNIETCHLRYPVRSKRIETNTKNDYITLHYIILYYIILYYMALR